MLRYYDTFGYRTEYMVPISSSVIIGYVYTLNFLPSVSTVRAQYTDVDGVVITDEIIHTGNIDSDYETDQLDIEGYTFKEVIGDFSCLYTDAEQVVVYVYEKNYEPVNRGNAIVHHKDVSGNVLTPSVTLTGIVGTQYSSSQLTITSYTSKEIVGTKSGAFTSADQVVTYVYEKTLTNPTNDDSTLPQTGIQGNSKAITLSIVFGALLLACSEIKRFKTNHH